LVPLLNPHTRRGKLLRAAVPAVFCLLVFFFALHAKTAIYHGFSQPKVTPSTASKLWVSGYNVHDRVAPPASTPAFLQVLLVLINPTINGRPALDTLTISPSTDLCLRYSRRFLRPPPLRS
jgi:hypothetical protein